jgi:hypothetical protein
VHDLNFLAAEFEHQIEIFAGARAIADAPLTPTLSRQARRESFALVKPFNSNHSIAIPPLAPRCWAGDE